jgi:hypothetical protein
MFAWIGWADVPTPAEVARLEAAFTQYTSKRSQKTLRELQTLITKGDAGPKELGGLKKSLFGRLRATQIRLEFLRLIAAGESQKDARGMLAGQFCLSKTRIRALTNLAD